MKRTVPISITFLALFTLGVLSTLGAAELPASANDIDPLGTGDSIPATTVRTVQGDDIALIDMVSAKPTILIFYRGGWWPYCNKQLGQLSKIESEIIDLGYQILAVSADRPEKMRESVEKQDLTYVVLSDSTTEAAQAFGLAFQIDDKTFELFKGYGIDLEDASGEDHHILPVPAVYIVGTDGVILFDYVNPDYKVRIDPEELLEAARDHAGS